jgi:hypothetical protein
VLQPLSSTELRPLRTGRSTVHNRAEPKRPPPKTSCRHRSPLRHSIQLQTRAHGYLTGNKSVSYYRSVAPIALHQPGRGCGALAPYSLI